MRCLSLQARTPASVTKPTLEAECFQTTNSSGTSPPATRSSQECRCLLCFEEKTLRTNEETRSSAVDEALGMVRSSGATNPEGSAT